MKEIYRCLFDIIANPNTPKPYRELHAFLKRTKRGAEASGVATLLKNVFDENEGIESTLSERRQPGSDDQNASGSNAVCGDVTGR